MSHDELCRGDLIFGPEDLFRLLRRGREYLIEADRQLRGGGTPEEQAASAAWYEDMDRNDEWTGMTAEGHAACVHDIISYFEEQPDFVAQFDGKPFLIDGCWQKLRVAPALDELRQGLTAIEMRIGARSGKH